MIHICIEKHVYICFVFSFFFRQTNDVNTRILWIYECIANVYIFGQMRKHELERAPRMWYRKQKTVNQNSKNVRHVEKRWIKLAIWIVTFFVCVCVANVAHTFILAVVLYIMFWLGRFLSLSESLEHLNLMKRCAKKRL